MRPRDLCAALLRALEASEGRRRRRRRDTTPDALGLAIKRELLERALADDPDPDAFEGWLVARCQEAEQTVSTGAMRAMALEVHAEWRLATRAPVFADWLARGAPSDDTGGPDAGARRADRR
jgi:hypothetical protein